MDKEKIQKEHEHLRERIIELVQELDPSIATNKILGGLKAVETILEDIKKSSRGS